MAILDDEALSDMVWNQYQESLHNISTRCSSIEETKKEFLKAHGIIQ